MQELESQKKVSLHTILLGVGGSEVCQSILPTFASSKEFGLDSQMIHKTALKLHAHSVLYIHKLTTYC